VKTRKVTTTKQQKKQKVGEHQEQMMSWIQVELQGFGSPWKRCFWQHGNSQWLLAEDKPQQNQLENDNFTVFALSKTFQSCPSKVPKQALQSPNKLCKAQQLLEPSFGIVITGRTGSNLLPSYQVTCCVIFLCLLLTPCSWFCYLQNLPVLAHPPMRPYKVSKAKWSLEPSLESITTGWTESNLLPCCQIICVILKFALDTSCVCFCSCNFVVDLASCETN
jgi:hypothetical protein